MFLCFSKYFVTVSKVLFEVSQSLKMENEEFKKSYNDATSKALQLEEDIVSVTHKAIEKETELDRYSRCFKKVSLCFKTVLRKLFLSMLTLFDFNSV